jgi:hypothetical protein
MQRFVRFAVSIRSALSQVMMSRLGDSEQCAAAGKLCHIVTQLAAV